MMLHVPQVLTREEARALRRRLDDSDWVDGRATVGPQGAQVKRNRQLAEHGALGRELGAIVLKALERHPLFFPAALPLRIAPPLFNRYEDGGHYGSHIDGSVRRTFDGGHVRTDVSCTLALSEPEDYDGGELVVEDTYGTHEVKLPAGDLILYPSTSLHQVLPVTRGARVSSFFWVQSMIRHAWQRTMLFDLDQNIQKLRERIGDGPELVGLAGHYHNLLREWAET